MTVIDLPSKARGDRAVSPIWRLALKRVSPIVCLNDGETNAPIYCIHPVTGDVVGLRELAGLMGRQSFFGIQVPKEKMNGAFGASIEGIARHYVGLLVAFQPDGPLNLAGWSAGAIVALEMAQQLRAMGREVPLLVALDGAPCNTGGGLAVWHPLYMLRLLVNLPRWIRDDRRQDWSVRGVAKRIRSKLAFRFGVGAAPLPGAETLQNETVQRVLDIDGWSPGQKTFIHAMYKAMLDYVPRPYAGRVIVYETQTQPLYHLRQIGAAWAKIAKNVEIVRVRGNHSDMIAQPAVGRIARHLLGALRPQAVSGA